MGSAGHSGRTSDQFVAVEKSRASSSRVTSVAKSFSALTTTVRASMPTWNSATVRPMPAQDSASLSLILREELAMSVSPATQKRSRPAPEPIESMVSLPPKPSSSKRCFMRSESGNTVEEPALTISPETASGAYIANGSSTGASVAVGSAGALVGSTGAVVGSTAGGASVDVAAPPHAASTKLIAISTNINERTNLVISTFSFFYMLLSYQPG